MRLFPIRQKSTVNHCKKGAARLPRVSNAGEGTSERWYGGQARLPRVSNAGEGTSEGWYGGQALLFTLFVMITLTSVVGAYLGFVQHSTRSTGAQIDSSKAFYLAEAGLQRYVFFLKYEQDYRDNHPNLNENLGDGSYSVQASFEQPTDTYTISSTGTVGAISRQITQSFVVTPAVIERSIHADGTYLKLTNSSGMIDGNVSCFTSVLPEPLPAGLTITGDVYQGDEQAKINGDLTLSTYYALAYAAGQVATNKTFANATYTGIWYITNKATIGDNARIEGSVICEKRIDFNGKANNVFIDPALYDPNQNYPALYAGGSITSTDTGNPAQRVGLQNSAINGLIFSGGNITFDYMSNTTFNGTILATNSISMENGRNFTVTYNPDIWDPMPLDFSFSGEATITVQNDWNEI